MARMTMEQGAARWRQRADRMRAIQPTSFRGAMAEVQRESQGALVSMVGTRSGTLKNAEVVRLTGQYSAVLTNTANSVWKGVRTYYGWVVAKGRRAANKGNRYFAWMKNPRDPRPTTWAEWLQARESGRAVLTHSLKATPARDWRRTALENIRRSGVIASRLRRGTREAME